MNLEFEEVKKMKIIRRKDGGQAVHNALNGITYAIEKEHNLLYIMGFILLVLILSIFLPVNMYEVLTIIIVAGITFCIEMMNTSIEAVTDLVTTKENELAKIAKDSASSAVFIMTIVSVVTFLVIFVPKILESVGLI